MMRSVPFVFARTEGAWQSSDTKQYGYYSLVPHALSGLRMTIPFGGDGEHYHPPLRFADAHTPHPKRHNTYPH